jgi:hypothetical protein
LFDAIGDIRSIVALDLASTYLNQFIQALLIPVYSPVDETRRLIPETVWRIPSLAPLLE